VSNWIKVKLGDIVELKRESYQPKPDEVLPYIGLEHIGQGTLRLISVGKSNEVTSTKSYFSKGDILFGKLRPYFRKVVRPKFNGVCSTDILVLTSKNPRKFNQTFLFYLMASQEMIDLATASSSGTKMPRADWKVLQNLEISIPEDVNEQERIGKILETIDDKIDINIRMNKTLEEMAMTLYKHWFVDFGPFQDGEFVESELGMIPEGWECIEIGEAVSVLGGGTPKTSVKEYWENGDINWFSPTDLTTQKSLFISKSSKKITKLGLEKSSAKLFPPYCVMMTSRATIGEISINREEACTNQGFITLIPNETFTMYQLYFWLKTNMDLILSIANGSTFKEVSKTNFKKLKILKPKNIEEFTQKCEKLFKLIESNLIEIEELTNIKDYLLPRLLSGEIDVSQAEKQVEEVL